MCGVHTRASPSGKASASQADTRGFESRCPLQEFEGTSNGAFCMCGPRARTRTRWGREAEQTRERLPASVRGCEASEAADSRSEYASPVARSRNLKAPAMVPFACVGPVRGLETRGSLIYGSYMLSNVIFSSLNDIYEPQILLGRVSAYNRAVPIACQYSKRSRT